MLLPQRHRAAIRARVASRAQDACDGIPQNNLSTPEEGALVPRNPMDGVSHLFESRERFGGHPLLDRDATLGGFRFDAEARQVERGLWIETVVHERGQDLDVSLRLHESAHHSIRSI